MKSKVSIIIPIYNVGEYIRYSILSTIKQTYQNIELILVDDGSTDSSVEVAEQLLQSHYYEYTIIHQENKGQGYARNAGLDVSSGEWVYFMDADDAISSNAISCMTEYATDSVDLVFSKYQSVTGENALLFTTNAITVNKLSGQKLMDKFLKRNLIVLAPATLYRKSVLTNNGLRFKKIPWSEDQLFVWNVLRYVRNAVFVKDSLYHYVIRSNSIMHATKDDAMLQGYKEIALLEDTYKDNPRISKYIVGRWVIGTARQTVGQLGYKEWNNLLKKMEYKLHFKSLLTFPDFRIRISAFMGMFSDRLFYNVFQRR